MSIFVTIIPYFHMPGESYRFCLSYRTRNRSMYLLISSNSKVDISRGDEWSIIIRHQNLSLFLRHHLFISVYSFVSVWPAVVIKINQFKAVCSFHCYEILHDHKKEPFTMQKLLQWTLFPEAKRMALWIVAIVFSSKNVESLCEFCNTEDYFHTLVSSLKYFKKQVSSNFSYSWRSMVSLRK